MKQIDETECRLRDAWNAHAFARRDKRDKMQQSRLKMLMGAACPQDNWSADTAGSWW